MRTYSYTAVGADDLIEAIVKNLGMESDYDLVESVTDQWSFGDAEETLVDPDEFVARLFENLDDVTETQFQEAVKKVYATLPEEFFVGLGG